MLRQRKWTGMVAGLAPAVVSCLVALALVGCGATSSDALVGAAAGTRAGAAASDVAGGAGDGSARDVGDATAARSFDYEAMVERGVALDAQVVNGGVPFFTESELALAPREEYAPLDALGRCGAATLLAGPETAPRAPRPDISPIRPTGWAQARYDSIPQSNGALYNRSHLVARSLGGDDVAENLITGTAHLNQGLMDGYEELARGQVRAGRHVLWRVTPVFEGDELVARGVLVEGRSVEDGGAGLTLCVWCPNAQPGVEIDYATGESREATDAGDSVGDESADANAAGPRYVLNTRSMVYHLPDRPCSDSIADRNRGESDGDAAALEAQGYRPCGSCHPDRVT